MDIQSQPPQRKLKAPLCKIEGCGQTDPNKFYDNVSKSTCKDCMIKKQKEKRAAGKAALTAIPTALPVQSIPDFTLELEAQISKLTIENRTLIESKSHLQTQVDDLQLQVEHLKTEVDSNHKTIGTLTYKIQHLSSQLNSSIPKEKITPSQFLSGFK
jgi:predicted RNase H-like nuclease (RuvC/YqgF family)